MHIVSVTRRNVYAAIEAGGTKFLCGIAHSHDEILDSTRIATGTADDTIRQCLEFFRNKAKQYGSPTSFGIGSFGALDPSAGSPRFGWITETPKAGWRYTDLAGPFAREFGVPVGFDTDVNAAALAEYRWGAGQSIVGGTNESTLVYLTVGTGIGGGAVVDGRLLHGLVHPEMGHLKPPRAPGDHEFSGVCAYHGDCLEGLACGPAITERWGVSAEELDADHEAWVRESFYLAHAVVSVTALLSPHLVVLGGGVMGVRGLIDKVRHAAHTAMGGYFPPTWESSNLNDYIVKPGLGETPGLSGAIALAIEAANPTPSRGKSSL